MSLITPTTSQISDNIINGLQASLNQSIPLMPKSFIRVLSKVLAAVYIVLWKYSGFIFLQQFVAYASNEPTEVNGKTVIPLQQWGELIGIGLPIPATQADLTIDITVTNNIGILPSGTLFIGTTNGVTYATLGDLDLTTVSIGDPISGQVRAVADQDGDGSGDIGNIEPDGNYGFC